MLNTVPAHFLSLFFFRQNLVIQCILNSQSCTHKDKLFLSLSLSLFSIEQNEADFLFPSPYLSPDFSLVTMAFILVPFLVRFLSRMNQFRTTSFKNLSHQHQLNVTV